MAWLAMAPAAGLKTHIPDVDFRCLLKWHLGEKILPHVASCPRCDHRSEEAGHHLVCCNRNGITMRHGLVQDFLLRLAHRAGVTARREEALQDKTRPGDIFFPRMGNEGPTAVDVSVRDTLMPSNPLSHPDKLLPWYSDRGDEKRRKYASQCARVQWKLIPFIMDCYGGLSPEGRPVMDTLIRAQARQQPKSLSREIEATAWQGLGMTLAQAIGRQLRLATLTRMVFMEEVSESAASSHNPYQ